MYFNFDIVTNIFNKETFFYEFEQKIRPALAKYDSNYGFNFYEGPNYKERTKDYIKVLTPLLIKPFLRQLSKKPQNMSKIKVKQDLIFEKKSLLIDKYINIDNIHDITMHSRALTLEYFYRRYL